MISVCARARSARADSACILRIQSQGIWYLQFIDGSDSAGIPLTGENDNENQISIILPAEGVEPQSRVMCSKQIHYTTASPVGM